jgi:membrane associated rhomboid family serine protease
MTWRKSWNEPTGGRYRYVRVRWQGSGSQTGLYALLILNVIVFLFLQRGSMGPAVNRYGPLSASGLFLHGRVWQLVTSQFLHASTDHILVNMFVLWMFGHVVEMQVGTRRFLTLYLACGVAGGLGECLFNVLMTHVGWRGYMDAQTVGASAGVMGTVIAYAVMNPTSMIYVFFVLPVPAKWLAIGYFVLESYPLVREFTQGHPAAGGGPAVAHAAHLGGMIYALLWAAYAGYIRSPLARGFQTAIDGLIRPFRPTLEVRRNHPVVGGPNSPPRDGPTALEEERLDAILRKIHEHGLNSLTEDERRFLRDMSERRRDDG